eukprot:Hpha_TRINITY_DN15507_c0_g1::TRINITY_DN15507_c0_g1_i1::g.104878::m.104878
MSRPRSPVTGSGGTRTTSPPAPRRSARGNSRTAVVASGRNRWKDFNHRRDKSPNFRARRTYRRVGKYRIEDAVVGTGAYSVVQPAHDTISGKEYVAKIVKKRGTGDEDKVYRDDVDREVAVLRHLPRHKHIVEFVELLSEPGEYLLILEAVSNGDLCDAILECVDNKVPEERARRFFRMMTEALLCCHHHGVAHRDVKPENMLVNERDEVKLSDFGVARIHQTRYRCKDERDMSYELVGTLRYAAPELFFAHFDGKPYDDFIADVWSLGVCLYVMLTGNFPYSSGPDMNEEETQDLLLTSDAVWDLDCSPEALALMRSLLEKDPSLRIDLREVPSHSWLALPAQRGPLSPMPPPRDGEALCTGFVMSCREAAQAHGKMAINEKEAQLREQQSFIADLKRRITAAKADIEEQETKTAGLRERVEAKKNLAATSEAGIELAKLQEEKAELIKSNREHEAKQRKKDATGGLQSHGRARLPTNSPVPLHRPVARSDVLGGAANRHSNSPSANRVKVRSPSPRLGGRLPSRTLRDTAAPPPRASNSPVPGGSGASRTATPPRPLPGSGMRTTTPPRTVGHSRTATPPRNQTPQKTAAQRRLSPAGRAPGLSQLPSRSGYGGARVTSGSPGRSRTPVGGTRTASSSASSVRRNGGSTSTAPNRVGVKVTPDKFQVGDRLEYRKDQDSIRVEGVVRYIGPAGGTGVEMVGIEVVKSLGRTTPRMHDGRGCFTPEKGGTALFCNPGACRLKRAAS